MKRRRAAVVALVYLAACVLASALLLRAIPWLLGVTGASAKWQSVLAPLREASLMPGWPCLGAGLLFGAVSALTRGRGRLWALIAAGAAGAVAVLLLMRVNDVPILYPALTLLRLWKGGLLDAL